MVAADARPAIAVGNVPSCTVLEMGRLVSREAAMPATPRRVSLGSGGRPQDLAAGAAGLAGGHGHVAPGLGT